MINMIVDCCSCCHEDADLCPNAEPVTYEVEVSAPDVWYNKEGLGRPTEKEFPIPCPLFLTG